MGGDAAVKISAGNGEYKMDLLQIILGAVLLAASVFLIVVIMLQNKKKRGLSGAIAGGTDT
mgnify:FL=1